MSLGGIAGSRNAHLQRKIAKQAPCDHECDLATKITISQHGCVVLIYAILLGYAFITKCCQPSQCLIQWYTIFAHYGHSNMAQHGCMVIIYTILLECAFSLQSVANYHNARPDGTLLWWS